MTEAMEIGRNATLAPHSSPIRNVFVTGMGGSGIGANFTAAFSADELKVPFEVGKGYSIPKFVNKFTLAIVSSYSGNTEETLACFEQLVPTGAKIVVISSGGKAIARAKELGVDHIVVPSGWPAPRACLGFSIVSQLLVLQKMKLISAKPVRQLEAAIAFLTKEQNDLRTKGEKLAGFLAGKIPVIYTTDRMDAVALRFRQQVNENAKSLGWYGVIPEMNHNELVGWKEKTDQLAVVYLRNKDDFARNAVRMDINKKMIAPLAPVTEVFSKGKNFIERALYFVFLGDFTTCFLCDLRGYDSMEIVAIDYLKTELAKV